MTQQVINIGSGPNTKDGDPIREAFRKTDENFTELYGFIGSGYTGSAVGNGYTGSRGSLGYTGSAGSVGYTGSAGSIGGPGYQGSAGSVGYRGSAGDVGYRGSAGDKGPDGYQGSAGDVGYTGSAGEVGFTGSAGAGYTGSQGEPGPSGGYTGSQGATGYTGSEGFTGGNGFTGSAGYTGSQGEIGFTGSTGSGYTGSKGDPGEFGGASFTYRYSTSVSDTDPGTGWVRFNNSLLSSATIMRLSYYDFDNVNIYNFLQTIDDSTSSIKGHFSVVSKYNPNGVALFAITGTHNEDGTHFDIPISWVSGSPILTNESDVVITFARTGDIGDTGYTGSRGYTGSSSIPQGTKTSNSAGNPGDTSYDTNYFYICIGSNSWKRIALDTII